MSSAIPDRRTDRGDKLSSTDDLLSSFNFPAPRQELREPAPAPASDNVGRAAGASGDSGSAGEVSTGTRAEAIAVWESIGREFVELRKQGRSQAWADLEDKVVANSHRFIAHGLISPKDLVGMLIDIEQFRKQEQGTQQAPGDWLADWLSPKPEDAAGAEHVPQAKRVTERKGLSKKQKEKQQRILAAQAAVAEAEAEPDDEESPDHDD